MRRLLLLFVWVASAHAQEADHPDPAILTQLQSLIPAGWDSPPPVIPANQDGWPLLEMVGGAFPWLSADDPRAQTLMAFSRHAGRTSDDQAQVVGAWLNEHDGRLAQIRAAVAKPGFNRPSDDRGVDDPRLHVGDSAAGLLLISADYHILRHEDAAAWYDAGVLLTLSERLASSARTGFDDLQAANLGIAACVLMSHLATTRPDAQLIAAAWQALGPDRTVAMGRMVQRLTASTAALRTVADLPEDGDAMVATLADRCAFDRLAVAGRFVARTDPQRFVRETAAAKRDRPEIMLLADHAQVLDRAATIRERVELAKALAAQPDPATWAEVEAFFSQSDVPNWQQHAGLAIRLFDNPGAGRHETPADHERLIADTKRLVEGDANPIGMILNANWADQELRRGLILAYGFEASRRLTRLAFAIALIRLRTNGTWPDPDDEIRIPGLLDAMPTDPFDGQSLRYDRNAKAIWSTGPDLTDDHAHRTRDVVISLVADP